LTDKTRLESWSLEIVEPGSKVIVFSKKGFLAKPSFALLATWTGLDAQGKPLAPGEYKVVVVARDQAGHETTATTVVSLCAPGQVVMGATCVSLAADPGPDAGTTAEGDGSTSDDHPLPEEAFDAGAETGVAESAGDAVAEANDDLSIETTPEATGAAAEDAPADLAEASKPDASGGDDALTGKDPGAGSPDSVADAAGADPLAVGGTQKEGCGCRVAAPGPRGVEAGFLVVLLACGFAWGLARSRGRSRTGGVDGEALR
jgi:hypothetical protein